MENKQGSMLDNPYRNIHQLVWHIYYLNLICLIPFLKIIKKRLTLQLLKKSTSSKKKNKLAVVACACASVSEYITTSRSAIAYVFVYCKNICQHSSVNYKINSYSVKAFRIPPISIILFIKRRLSLKLSSNANPLL